MPIIKLSLMEMKLIHLKKC